MTVLHAAAVTGLTLPRALEASGLDGGCALLTTPSAYRVASVTGGTCRTPEGVVDLSAVYEARVFTGEAELRWTGESAVLLAEDRASFPPAFDEEVEDLEALTTLDNHYLLWGVVDDSASPGPGWVALSSSRVGRLTVPMATAVPRSEGHHRRVRLLTREYVVVGDDHGNVHVAEERLIGFETYRAKGIA
ncbi:CRISPR-associated protein Csx19 [Streptosporangium sp. NPDC020072]|uniref:type III-D CRISPR-associated protein Csx19 n=1 Tax=Streptosporangium sp. NPDC020072 TaxID=3154788 RepID=UPI00341FF3FB